jgi:glucokinase
MKTSLRQVSIERSVFLGADLGGMHARFRCYELAHPSGQLRSVHEFQSVTRSYRSLRDLLTDLMRTAPPSVARRLRGACFGVSGTIFDNHVATSRLADWLVDTVTISDLLGGIPMHLINDVESFAWGLDEPEQGDVIVGRPPPINGGGVQAVITLGSGVGAAAVVPGRWGPTILPSEAGQAAVNAAGNGMSWEEALLSPALKCSCGSGYHDPRPRLEEPACAACRQFAAVAGRFASSMALAWLARGGVVFGGGLSRRLLNPVLIQDFRDGWSWNAMLNDIVATGSVRVITDQWHGAKGAARYAVAMLDEAFVRNPIPLARSTVACGLGDVPSRNSV